MSEGWIEEQWAGWAAKLWPAFGCVLPCQCRPVVMQAAPARQTVGEAAWAAAGSM